MPRWYALCSGGGIAQCRGCRRLASRHPAARSNEPHVQPEIVRDRCHRFIEQPVGEVAAITPTDTRA